MLHLAHLWASSFQHLHFVDPLISAPGQILPLRSRPPHARHGARALASGRAPVSVAPAHWAPSAPGPRWTVTKPVLRASLSGARLRAAPAQRNEETGSLVRSRRLRAEGSGPPGLRERSREDGGCGRKCSEAVSSRFFLS